MILSGILIMTTKSQGRNVHAVYTLSNSAAGNEVIIYRRSGEEIYHMPDLILQVEQEPGQGSDHREL